VGLLGPGGGIVEPSKEAAQAMTNYLFRLWKISNHWRNPPTVVPKPDSTVTKILIVLSDTGGGHKASASSISSALQELEPGLEVKTVDVIENYTPWFSNRLYNVRVIDFDFAALILHSVLCRCLFSFLLSGELFIRPQRKLTGFHGRSTLSSSTSHQF
jgi:hypothetical protein